MDLSELYQDMILHHSRSPRNKGVLDDPTGHAEGHNPLCGDRVDIYVHVADGLISDVRFEGEGCAISTASASLMTESVKGKTVEEAEQIFRKFHRMVTEEGGAEELGEDFEKLEVLAGVREFPVRVKCATLAWHTLHAALAGEEQVSTE
jgi:nitrogen fixation protein NifU and related proteins